MKGKSLTLVALITLVLLGIILSQMDYRVIVLFLKRASLPLILLSFVTYTATYLLRAVRWRILLGLPLSIPSLFHIVCLHTLANNLFPFRTGELTFPYFLDRFHRVQLSSSLSSLFLARVSDMLALGSLFLVGLAAVGFPGEKTLALAIPAFMAVLFFSPWILAKLFPLLTPILKRSSSKMETFSQELQEQWKGKRAIMANLLSLAIWATKFLAFFLLAQEMTKPLGYPLNYWKVVVGTSASELTTVLPIHSIGGVGTYEAGWTGAFILMGMGKGEAVATAFLFHMTLLLFSVILGLPSYIMIPWRGKRE
ncbi:MAG: hypothetical protein DRI93_06875 [Aquificota bacterium]|nr:MAG: hypothetical protein DRI93_06875 [Aquificota bacterium]